MRQARVFLTAIGREERRQARETLLVLRAAQADRKSFSSMLKALEAP